MGEGQPAAATAPESPVTPAPLELFSPTATSELSSLGMSISFNMSPLPLELPASADDGVTAGREERSLSLGSSRTSLAPLDSPAPTLESPAPKVQAVAKEVANGGAVAAAAPLSKVAEMRHLWERRASAAAEEAGRVGRKSLSCSQATSEREQPQSSTKLRQAGRMMRRLRDLELRTKREVEQLMSRLAEAAEAAGVGSPPSKAASEAGSPQEEKEGNSGSPTSRLHAQLVRNLEGQCRSQQALSRAVLKIVALDAHFRQQRGKDRREGEAGAAQRSRRRTSAPQPEEEEEVSATFTDFEPAREPAPRESPREEEEEEEAVGLLRRLTELEEEEEVAAAEEAAVGDGIDEESPINGNSGSCSEPEMSSSDETEESSESEDDDDEEEDHFSPPPRPGEEGMPRSETFLHQLEQNELSKQVLVVVPEGMAENRLVSFVYENRKHDVRIPEGYSVGQEVTIFVPKRPPLERNPVQAACRGHAGFPDKFNLTELLKHSSRSKKPCSLQDPEFRHRRQLYSLLRGTSMTPLLPFTPEEEELSGASGGEEGDAPAAL